MASVTPSDLLRFRKMSRGGFAGASGGFPPYTGDLV